MPFKLDRLVTAWHETPDASNYVSSAECSALYLTFESADFHLLLRNNHTRFVDGSWGNSWACCHDTFSLVLEPFLRPRTILWMSWYCIECPLTVASTFLVNVLSSALNDSSSLDASKISWICCIDQEVSDVRGTDENVVSMIRLLLETWTRAKKKWCSWKRILVFICSMSSSCTGSSSLQWKASALRPNRWGINLVGDISYWLRSTRAANTSERKVLVTSGSSRSACWKSTTCVICNGMHTLISSCHFHHDAMDLHFNILSTTTTNHKDVKYLWLMAAAKGTLRWLQINWSHNLNVNFCVDFQIRESVFHNIMFSCSANLYKISFNLWDHKPW